MSETPLDINAEQLITMDDLRQRYNQLCAYRDAVEQKIAPLRAQLADANEAAEKARVYAQTIAEQLSKARGGSSWFILKKNIGTLAKALGGK